MVFATLNILKRLKGASSFVRKHVWVVSVWLNQLISVSAEKEGNERCLNCIGIGLGWVCYKNLP